MELRQLKYFLAILDHANFNRAAESLHVTQPALSKSMRALEEELGVELLERGAGGVVPTPFGRILADAARGALNELRRSVEEINALATRGSGRILVGGGTVVLRYLMPPTCERLMRDHGNVEVVIVELLRSQLLMALSRGELDVAICPAPDDELAPGLAQEFLLRDRIGVVAHHTHPLCSASTVSIRDLAGCRWIVPSEQERERKALQLAMLEAGQPPPRVAVETASSTIMAQLISQQDYLSYLPTILLAADPTFAELRLLPTPPIWQPRDLSLVYRRSSVPFPAMAAFLSAVRSAANDIGIHEARRVAAR